MCVKKTTKNDDKKQKNIRENIHMRIRNKKACANITKKYPKLSLSQLWVFVYIGMTGLEPATSTSLMWRSSQTEPHPENFPRAFYYILIKLSLPFFIFIKPIKIRYTFSNICQIFILWNHFMYSIMCLYLFNRKCYICNYDL